MTNSVKIFKAFSAYNPVYFTDHKVNISGTDIDAHGQSLKYMDKVIFSSSKGWYSYGYFLGTTLSGKSAKVLSFAPTAIKNFSLDIHSWAANNILKIDWSDHVCPGIQNNLIPVFNQIAAGLDVIEVR